MRRLFRAASLILALTTVISFLGVGTAYATVYQEYATNVSSSPPSGAPCVEVWHNRTRGGKACFEAHGDEFWIRDYDAEGWHVEMRAQLNTNGNGFRCYTYRGPSATWQRCDSFSDNIPEDGRLIFSVSLWDGGTQKIASSPIIVNAS
jgi:hypothetical protein